MAETDTTTPPACPKCGAATFPTTRTMRTHDIEQGRAIARDKEHDVWRCMRCTTEIPRS